MREFKIKKGGEETGIRIFLKRDLKDLGVICKKRRIGNFVKISRFYTS